MNNNECVVGDEWNGGSLWSYMEEREETWNDFKLVIHNFLFGVTGFFQKG